MSNFHRLCCLQCISKTVSKYTLLSNESLFNGFKYLLRHMKEVLSGDRGIVNIIQDLLWVILYFMHLFNAWKLHLLVLLDSKKVLMYVLMWYRVINRGIMLVDTLCWRENFIISINNMLMSLMDIRELPHSTNLWIWRRLTRYQLPSFHPRMLLTPMARPVRAFCFTTYSADLDLVWHWLLIWR